MPRATAAAVTKKNTTPAAAEAAAEYVAPSMLKPWARNPRKNDGEPVAKVAESIKRFGFAAPIVAMRSTGEIIAGHTRWKAALKLGLDRVPVRYMDIDEREAHLLALADNRLGELADWDVPELHSILADYQAPDALVAGWDDAALAALMHDHEEPAAKPKDKEENHCPTCGRYMSERLRQQQRKRTAGAT